MCDYLILPSSFKLTRWEHLKILIAIFFNLNYPIYATEILGF